MNASSLKSTSLQFMWLDQFEFAGFYIAKEKGFYAQEGIDVNFIPYNPNKDTFDALFDGTADFSTGSASILIKHAQNKNKITILSTVFQSSPLMLLGIKDYGIEKLEDIKGKKVMLTNEQQSFATFQTMLRSHNVSLSEIQVIPHSYNVDDLIHKKTDLMVAYTTNEPYILQEKGYQPQILHPKEYGFDFYEELIFTSQKMVEIEPDLVEAFHKATIKGWLYAFNNIEESAKLIYEKYNPQKKSLESLIFEGNEMKKLAFIPGVEFGSVNIERLKSIEQSYRIMNLLEKSVDYYGMIYNPSYKLFSEEERAYLWNKGTLKMCVLKDNHPFELYVDGLYQGLVAEYVNKITKHTKLPIEWVVSENIDESLLKLRYGQCDIVPMTIQNSLHDKTLEYTSSYLEQKIAIISDHQTPFIKSIEDTAKLHISVLKNSELKEHLKTVLPNKEFLEINSISQAIELIKEGVIDIHIGTLYEVNSALAKNDTVRINTIVDAAISNSAAVRFNDKNLQSIVSKIFNNINQKEKQEIENRWLQIEIVKVYEKHQILFFISLTLIVLATLYGGYLYFRRAVKKSVDARVLEEMIFFEHNKLSSIGKLLSIIGINWKENISKIRVMQKELRESVTYEQNQEDIEKSLRKQQLIVQEMSQEIENFLTLYKSDKAKENLNIYRVFQDAKEIWKHSLENTTITLREDIDKSLEIYTSKNELLQLFLSIIDYILERFKTKNIEDGFIYLIIKKEAQKIIIVFQDSDSEFDEHEMVFDRKKQSSMMLSLYTTQQMLKENFNGSIKVSKNQIGRVFEIELGVHNG